MEIKYFLFSREAEKHYKRRSEKKVAGMKPATKGVMKKNILLLVCLNYRELFLETSYVGLFLFLEIIYFIFVIFI